MKIASVTLALLLATAATADAQCRSRTTYSTYSYAQPSYSYSTYSPAYVAPAYVAPKVVKEETFVKFLVALPIVALPSYSAVYSPPPAAEPVQSKAPNGNGQSSLMQQLSAQNVQILDAVTRLDASVKRLETRVENLERAGRFQQPQAPAPGPQPEVIPKQPNKEEKKEEKVRAVFAVNAQRCAICHQRGNEKNGGDLVLSDEKGNVLPLTDSQLVSLSKTLGKGKMPKLNERAKQAGIVAALTKTEMEAWYEEIDRQINSRP